MTNVDYKEIFRKRLLLLDRLNKDPNLVHAFKLHYKTHPIDFIKSWGITYDPRKRDGDPKLMPFSLFPIQEDLVTFFDYLQDIQKNGSVDKSRDMGATWVAAAYSWHQFLFVDGSAIGFGSRKQELVDRLGDPKTIFEKIRQLFHYTPQIFLPKGFNPKEHLTFMKCINPENGSSITGEAGDNIGRGGRTSIFFKDEAAFFEHPESIEAALGENTNVQVDISTHNGTNTLFYEGVNNYPADRVFVLDWKDHPDKTQEWYDEKKAEYSLKGLNHLFAQEIDRDPSASISRLLIPKIWIDASIDLHKRLNSVVFTGKKVAGLDVADEGGDLNSLVIRNGNLVEFNEAWGDGDTADTTKKAFHILDEMYCNVLNYDSIGVGAGVKATGKELNVYRNEEIKMNKFIAGGVVSNPEEELVIGRLNKDMFENIKAQTWWMLRIMFEATYKRVVKKEKVKNNLLISISSEIPEYQALCRELAQPTYNFTGKGGKIIIDKKPKGSKSPNRADALIIAFADILNEESFQIGI